MKVLQIAFWLALVVWLGAVIFFSFVVAPAVFRTLPRESAGQVTAAIFPAYYRLGIGAGAVALFSAAALWRRAPGRAWAAVTTILGLMLLATIYAGVGLQPRAHALRAALAQSAADPGLQREFERLHRLAVQLNGAVLVLGLLSISLAASSFRLPESGSNAGR